MNATKNTNFGAQLNVIQKNGIATSPRLRYGFCSAVISRMRGHIHAIEYDGLDHKYLVSSGAPGHHNAVVRVLFCSSQGCKVIRD